ncbi:MAG TPA: lasso peptide biosynthesis B2 protein [Vicinamibacterales bacterium]|nr:lasso peptide biosynthesis B2 protein [Vicinamibacterales bacterium]
MIALYQRFTSLDRSNRRLVLETASLMALVWAGLRLFRFPTLRRALDCYVRSRTTGHKVHPQPNPATIARVRWAITVVADRFPPATCLVQALTADAILRRRGISCELRIGVRGGGNGSAPIEAHAWIDCDDAVAIGAIEDLSEFRVLAAPRPA